MFININVCYLKGKFTTFYVDVQSVLMPMESTGAINSSMRAILTKKDEFSAAKSVVLPASIAIIRCDRGIVQSGDRRMKYR